MASSLFTRRHLLGGQSRRSDGRYIGKALSTKGTLYIDEWFGKIKKPASFYEALSNEKIRRYFYNIDLQGRLFLEETSPKNIATSIKDEKFLNFFFSRIRWASPMESDHLQKYGFADDYPFVSKCGAEINYIRPAATPIVFHSMVGGDLLYGGNLVQPFDSSRLAISQETGRLYHQIILPDGYDDQTHKKNTREMLKLGFGLIRSSLAVSLSEKIQYGNSERAKFRYNGDFEIDWLASANEPGSWGMPDDGLGN
jgi:Domain of unknown function (DUF4505)